MIFTTLQKTKLPCAYSHFSKPVEPPYLVYLGSGQNNLPADNTLHWKEDTYQVEYYFKEKNEAKEAEIEEILLADGYIFTKSEDIYIESEGLFVIYYQV